MKYLNNVADGADGKHNPISSFYIWAWDANADHQFGLGGMVELDYETLNWPKMAMLMENSTDFTYGLGLTPWYMPGYIELAGKLTSCLGLHDVLLIPFVDHVTALLPVAHSEEACMLGCKTGRMPSATYFFVIHVGYMLLPCVMQ